jgi:RNA polymerase sigma factor (sigma-70 family)
MPAADDLLTEGRQMSEAATVREDIARLFAENAQRMARRARHVLRSEDDADDAVQEVMLTLVRAPHVLGAVERVGAWLLSLVHRRCVDIVREGRRRGQRAEEAAGSLEELFPDEDPAVLAERDELCAAVAGAVDALPPELRWAFTANVLEEKPFRRMSEESGVPMGTLMARKSRAVELVRGELERRGFRQERG